MGTQATRAQSLGLCLLGLFAWPWRLWRHGANEALCISGHLLSISSPFAIAGPVLMTQLTVLVVSFVLFCNFEFVCLDHSFFYSLCVFNGGCIITDCPLGPARRFLHNDAG